jgi:hypothetical protein
MHLIQTTTTSVLLLSLLSTRAMAFGTSNKISAGVGGRGLRGAGGGAGRSYNDDFEPPEDGIGDRGLGGGDGHSYAHDDFVSHQQHPEDHESDQTLDGGVDRGLGGGDGRPYYDDDFW